MGRADTKVGLSDPAVLDGKAVAQQIKGTPGITGLSPLSVHSGEEVWHLNTLGCYNSNVVPKISAYNGEPVSSCQWSVTDNWEIRLLVANGKCPVTPWEVVGS